MGTYHVISRMRNDDSACVCKQMIFCQNISETVRDRCLVPKDHQQEIAYGESNWHVTDDITGLNNSSNYSNNNNITYLSDWSVKFGDVLDPLPTKQPFWDRPGVLNDKARWKPASHLHISGHRCLQLLHSTVATGSLYCQLPHVGSG